MYFSLLLHIHQPPNQFTDVLKRIVDESYRPIFKGLLEKSNRKITLNMPGGLSELLLENGYADVLETIKKLAENNQLELTSTAKYHAFLPLLPKNEIIRQIKANEETQNQMFGQAYQPKGFFPPEMAYAKLVSEVLFQKFNFEYMLAPMIAYGPTRPKFERTYILKRHAPFKVFFRDKWASAVILSGYIRTVAEFKEWLGDRIKKDEYVLAVMDGETFGHHRVGLTDFLFELLDDADLNPITVSEISKHFGQTESATPFESTWTNSEQDFWVNKEKRIAAKHPFILWQDPNNPIHKLQWELTNLAIKVVGERERWQEQKSPADSAGKNQNDNAGVEVRPSQTLVNQKLIAESTLESPRAMLDKALASDQYWWASAKPWWSLEMVEAGAYALREVVFSSCLNNHCPVGRFSEVGREQKSPAESTGHNCQEADNLYRAIIAQAFEWQRSGYIRAHTQTATQKMPPFKDRAGLEEYNQIILELEDEMKRAAVNLDFERAIKWRDAIYKLKSGIDVYDALHVVDELQAFRRVPSLKPWREIKNLSDFAGKHMRLE